MANSVQFPPELGGDNSVYSDDDNPDTGLANGGSIVRLIPMFSKMIAAMQWTINAITDSVSSVNKAALSALGGATTNATSTSNLTVSTGSKTITLAETGKAYVVGQYVSIALTATPATNMIGQITAFSGTTLTVNVLFVSGSGSGSAWTISITGKPMSANTGSPTNITGLLKGDGSGLGVVVSGTDIKTIGGVSLLGAGNIDAGTIKISNRTSTATLGVADKGKIIKINTTDGSTTTQVFDVAATLGDGWFCYLHNSGLGKITLDPSGTETIDGLTSFIMYPNEMRLIVCDSTAFYSFVTKAFSVTFTSSQSFIIPPGYTSFEGFVHGGGGGGAKGTPSSTTSILGGGGGGCCPIKQQASLLTAGASVTVYVGSGGTGASSSGSGGSTGGASDINFASAGGTEFVAFGGQGGLVTSNTTAFAQGGGLYGTHSGTSGQLALDLRVDVNNTLDTLRLANPFGGGGCGFDSYAGYNPDRGNGVYGGAASVNNAMPGGNSVYGGGAGGKIYLNNGASGGGASILGGYGSIISVSAGWGGDASLTASGSDGKYPAGGGGATSTGAKAGNGGRGEIKIWGVI